MAGVVTGSSVLSMAFDGGVIMAADTVCSYGSMARFRNCERIKVVNDHTVVAASGDYATFQFLVEKIEQKEIAERQNEDNLSPKALHSWITRLAYQKRSKMEPMLCEWVVGGMQPTGTFCSPKKEPFLGYVDKLGTAYKNPVICTGMGLHLAVPLIRETTESMDRLPTEDEARKLIRESMEVLYYRDGRSLNKYQIVTVKADGVKTEEPITFNGRWEMAYNILGY